MNLKLFHPTVSQRAWQQLAILTLLFLITGCAKTGFSLSPYPAPGNVQQSGAISSNPTLSPYTFVRSRPGYATLHGRLILTNPDMLIPKPDGLYLVPIENDPNEINSIPEVNERQHPQADIDERTGEFVFANIQPGRYAVVAITQFDTQIVTKVWGAEQFVSVIVRDSDLDQTLDLGLIRIP